MSTINAYSINDSFKQHWKHRFSGVSYSCRWALLYKKDLRFLKIAGNSIKNLIGISILLDTTLSAAQTKRAFLALSHNPSWECFSDFSHSFLKTLRGSCLSSAILLPLNERLLTSALGVSRVITIFTTLEGLHKDLSDFWEGKEISLICFHITEHCFTLMFSTALLLHRIGTPWIILLGESIGYAISSMNPSENSTAKKNR